MAGYLGKISAVVSVNNSDVKPKLDASSQAVSNFARGVERDLRAASSGAAKAFDGIYTPLQKMERAMYAASTMKLSFKGFEGAIRDVDGLRSRLASLSRQRINLDVTGSGFRSIEEMRKAIGNITSKDISAVAEVGGLEQFRGLVGAMNDAERTILAKFERLNSLDQIKVAIDVVGQASFDAAEQKMRKTAMAAEKIAAPLNQAASLAASFGLEMQQSVAPALIKAQAAAERVRLSLDRPGTDTIFSSAARQARELLVLMKQIDEARGMAAGTKTGRELAFSNPQFAAQLAKAQALADKAANLPAGGMTAQIAALTQQQFAAVERANAAFARRTGVRGDISEQVDARAAERKIPRKQARAEIIGEADAAFAKAQADLETATQRLAKKVPLDVDTTQATAKVDALTLKLQSLEEAAARALSGSPQTTTQAFSEFNRIINQFEKLDDAQRQALAPNVNSFISAFRGGEANLANILAALQKLDTATKDALQVNIRTEEAKAKVDALRESLKNVANVVTPQRTPLEQLRIDAEEAKAAIDKVKDATAKAALQKDLDFVAAGVSRAADPKNPALAGLSDAEVDRFVADAQRRFRGVKGRADVASAPTDDDVFGPALGSAKAKVNDLQSTIKSLQSSIAQLPGPLQARLIPALESARKSFMALGASPTAAAIAKAAQEAENLEAGLKRAQNAAKFSGTFASFLDDTAADRYAAQLNTIRQSLLAVGATASGPVANAIDEYQRALRDAGEAGTLGTEATKKQMDSLLQKIAQVGYQTEKQRTAFVQMVQSSGRGDVGRMGADKANLALQQAAFAVDDFMSSTGGLEHRLRAVSNNLTQMAFILGNTKALWLAVGATMVTTLAIPFLKAMFQFEDMESRTKALNNELEKSRNIAERTADAYRELGKALRESGRGGAAGKTEGFVEDRRREARESAELAVFGVSEDYVRLASRLESLKTRLEKATDIADRAQIARDIQATSQSMEAMRSRGISPSPLGETAAMVNGARQAEIAALRRSAGTLFDAAIGGDSNRRLRAAISRPQSQAQTPEQAVAEIDVQIAGLRASLENMPVADWLARNYPRFLMAWEDANVTAARTARETLGRLEEERAKLEQDAALRRNERFMPRAMAAAAAAELTPQARDQVARLGLDSDVTAKFEADMEAISKHFGDVIVELEKAVREGRDTSALEAEADRAAQALEYLYQAADRYSEAVALGAIVPTQQRLQRAGESLAEVGSSNVATEIARVQARRQTIENQLERARARGDDVGVAGAELQLEQLRNLTARLESAAIATAAFQRALEDAALALSATLVQEAQAREQELRRGMNRGVTGAAQAFEESRAEADRQEARDRQLRGDLNRERLAFEQSYAADPELQQLANRVRDGRAMAENRTKSAAEQEAGRLDAEAAQAELDRRFEQRPEVVAARRRADAADAEVARRDEARTRANENRQRRMGGIESASRSGVAGSQNAESLAQSLSLDREARELQRKMEEAVSLGIDAASFDAPMAELRRKLETQAGRNLRELIDAERSRSASTEGQIEAARGNLAGIEASNLVGAITALEVTIRDMERRRDEAIAEGTPEGNERAAAIQEDIDAQKEHAAAINAATVAVGAFQEAMNRAALDLQNSLVGETAGRAVDARRAANDAEAVFGVGSPEGKRARARQERAEKAMRDAEDERRRAEAAINAERVKFEDEIARGDNPEAADRAKRIAELEADAANQDLGAARQAEARAEADRLRDEQRREFESRPEVQAERKRADDADREMATRQSAERGRDMMMSEEKKRMEEIGRQAGDLGNAVKEMRARGEGAGVRGGVREAAINMARDAAPLYAQLAEEVMNARLQGPSRAALNVSDISTSQGASELNRLIRGDDAAKDVNLVELKKQSNLLEAIEKAIRDQTGVVVNF